MPEETPNFGAILTALEDAGVRFVLIGGFAMAAHGSSLITQDMDVYYSRDPGNLEALATALTPFHPSLRGAPPGLPFVFDVRTLKSALNLTLTTEPGDIDLLGAVPGAESFDALWERSVKIEVFGRLIPVASLEDIVAMKRAADRPKDRLHLQELEQMHKERL